MVQRIGILQEENIRVRLFLCLELVRIRKQNAEERQLIEDFFHFQIRYLLCGSQFKIFFRILLGQAERWHNFNITVRIL